MLTYVNGLELSPRVQSQACAQFVHRFTRTHIPRWAQSNPNYKAQFADDKDWLAHTDFAVRKNGELDKRANHCVSSPTWPDGKGVWGQKGTDW